MTSVADRARVGQVSTPSVDSSLGMKLLPGVLSVTAGTTDVIGFLGLGGLFTAHITGNLVILAAHVVAGGDAPLAHMISVPIFVAVLGLAKLLAVGLERVRVASLRPLLLLQFLFLVGFLAICVAAGPSIDPNNANAIVAGMLGVSAMAVQGTLVQVSLTGAPPTAVMTTNITHFMMDLGDVLFGHSPDGAAKARDRARRTWPAILGFALGCGLGAECDAIAGLWSLALPASLALLALAMSFTVKLGEE